MLKVQIKIGQFQIEICQDQTKDAQFKFGQFGLEFDLLNTQ